MFYLDYIVPWCTMDVKLIFGYNISKFDKFINDVMRQRGEVSCVKFVTLQRAKLQPAKVSYINALPG